jgi:cobalt-zinc-cadmium efflux system outer membrane protein
MPNMPGMKPEATQHEHMQAEGIPAIYPRLGRAQENALAKLFSLEDAQRLAVESNPTLRQAEAEIRASKARQQQSGLYPNPTIGYVGDEIRGGSVGGGKQGFVVQQTIVTGGKLANSRAVLSKETQIAAIEAEEQKIRVETAVKLAFLRVLAAQELLDAHRDLAKIELDRARTQEQLGNSGQADESEILQAEIDARKQQLLARMQENALLEEWRSLAAVIGQPELPLTVVSGELERGWPEFDEAQLIGQLARESPASRIAGVAAERADADIFRVKRAAIPDLQLRGGLEYNNDTLGTGPYAKGWEGIAGVEIELPIFNRNQGNIGAAQADADRSRLERQRVALTLRQRATSVLDEYASAKLTAVEYREELLPRATKAYTLMNEKYGRMLASYPRVIDSQQRLYELHLEYIAALETVWTTGIALQGYLLTDGLEAPARPGEMDRPVREFNVPFPDSRR